MSRVVVSFTSLPSRMTARRWNKPEGERLLEVMVQHASNQTHQDYELQFNMPKRSELEGTDYVYPEWMEDYGVKVFECEDYGSHTKILPTLQREQDPETVIITFDDDICYHPQTIETHLMLRETKYPNAAIGFAGLSAFDEDMHFVTSVTKDVQVRVLEGYKSVSYLRKFFDDDYYQYAPRHWCDDTVLSSMLGKNGIEKWVCHFPGDEEHPEPKADTPPVLRWNDHSSLPHESSGCAVRKHGETKQATDAQECFDELIKNGWYDARPVERG